MHNSKESFRSADNKRLILIADDERINREILGEILKSEYDILFAADGEETLEKIRQNKDTLSLVLLDVLMPGMSGLEVLEAMKEEESLSRIPVIVTTSEKSTEVESLRLGAIDFIPKPYPAVDVILARIFRTIELSEDRETIQSTEHDQLTGLYNKEYFYLYAEQFDHHHRETEMDAVILDVSHFHLINERYGKAFGDEVLRRIGTALQDVASSSGGIACRQEADTFMLYCPHRENYESLMEAASAHMNDEAFSGNRIRLRMGVYSCTD